MVHAIMLIGISKFSIIQRFIKFVEIVREIIYKIVDQLSIYENNKL
jgi:hypothetical protein